MIPGRTIISEIPTTPCHMLKSIYVYMAKMTTKQGSTAKHSTAKQSTAQHSTAKHPWCQKRPATATNTTEKSGSPYANDTQRRQDTPATVRRRSRLWRTYLLTIRPPRMRNYYCCNIPNIAVKPFIHIFVVNSTRYLRTNPFRTAVPFWGQTAWN